jgi:hypothetical protein
MPEPHASLQRRLLTSERVAVDGNKIDMKLYGWTPKKSRGNSRKSKRKPAGRAKPKLRA